MIYREKVSSSTELPILCIGCKGFFTTSYKSRHQKICPATCESLMMLPTLSMNDCLVATQSLSPGFSELLNTLHLDDISDKIKSDEILLMIGNRYYSSLKRKRDKKIETTKYVRARLRLTARVLVMFERRMKNKNFKLDNPENNLADMFRRETITILGE